jgi:hypothetical protein
MPAPGFEYDLFISYAHLNNQPIPGGEKGWIDYLHEWLERQLSELLRRQAHIWRDRKLRGNDAFNGEIATALEKSALLLPVISPRYLESPSCREEIETFFRLAERRGGLQAGSKHRVFKVVKTHVPHQEHPPPLRGLLGYEFYEEEQASGRVREFDPVVRGNYERDKRYWDKFGDLVGDLAETLQLLERQPLAEPAPYEKTVYLAETSSDLRHERDQIRRELEQHEYCVLPDKELPREAPAVLDAVRDCLRRSRLAVHLVGSRYGFIPEDETRSIVRLQHELAMERDGEANFSRVIWLPTDLTAGAARDERQSEFITQLQQDSAVLRRVELLQTKLADLKTYIQDTLNPRPKPAPNGHEPSGVPSVYLICDQQDYDDVAALTDYLFDQNLEVLPTPAEGDAAAISQYHRESLCTCDAVLIYYGRGNETWARLNGMELQKLRGYGREKPLLAKAFYLSAPSTKPKERFRSNEALVIRAYEGGFDPAPLAPFLTQLGRMAV